MSHNQAAAPNSGLLNFLLQMSYGASNSSSSPSLGFLGASAPQKPAFAGGESNMLQQMLCNAMTAAQLAPPALFGGAAGPMTSPIFGHVAAQPTATSGLLDLKNALQKGSATANDFLNNGTSKVPTLID